MRSVYADWLHQRGDPRADAVRHVVAMAKAPMGSEAYWLAKAKRHTCRAVASDRWWAVVDPASAPLRLAPLPDDRARRWRALDGWLDRWAQRPLSARSGASPDRLAACEERLGVELPAALRELYALLGAREDLMIEDDYRWLPPEEIAWHVEDDVEGLLFLQSNNGPIAWGIQGEHLTAQDPPVAMFRQPANRPHAQRIAIPRLSTYAMLEVSLTCSTSPGSTQRIFPSHMDMRGPLSSVGFTDLHLGPGTFWAYDSMQAFEHPHAMAFVGTVSDVQEELWLQPREPALSDHLVADVLAMLERHA